MTTSKRLPTIALLQIHVPKDAVPAKQFARAVALIRSKCSPSDGQNPDLVVLPEMAFGLVPHNLDGQINYTKECAQILQKMQDLAKELSINIIPGSMSEMVEKADGQGQPTFYNTTYYINRSGEILLRYRKVNPWGPERLAFSSGTTHAVIQTPEFGPLGLLICWDLGFPEAFRALVKQGARTIVIPTQWGVQDCGPKGLAHGPNSERLFINSIMTARAFEQNCCIVFSNTGGPVGTPDDSDVYFGNSQITLPFKGPIVKLTAEEQIVVTEVDFSTILEDAEEVWNIREDIMGKNWYHGKEGKPLE